MRPQLKLLSLKNEASQRNKMATIHQVSITERINDIIGSFDDYVIISADKNCFEKDCIVEVLPGKTVQLEKLQKLSESFDLSNFYSGKANTAEIINFVNCPHFALKRMSRWIIKQMTTNNFDMLISYPLFHKEPAVLM